MSETSLSHSFEKYILEKYSELCNGGVLEEYSITHFTIFFLLSAL